MCSCIDGCAHGLMDVLMDCVPGGWIDGCAHGLCSWCMD
jgi:hypothetical protein